MTLTVKCPGQKGGCEFTINRMAVAVAPAATRLQISVQQIFSFEI
jgi:hypothetical protein